MFILKNLRIGTKLIALILTFTLGLILFAGFTFYTINNIDINSPAYQDIQRDNDLIADILPPPLYIVELHLVTQQIYHELEGGDLRLINELLSKAQQLQDAYQTRREYWLQVEADEEDSKIIQTLVVESYQYANEYFTIFNNEFIPAIQINDLESAQRILDDELTPLYISHRLVIDRIVKEQRTELAEDQVVTQAVVNQQRILLFGIAIFATLLSFLLATTIAQSISRPIKQLTTSAEQFTSGNLQAQAVIDSKDEIGKLAISFNEMASKVRNAFLDYETQVSERTQALNKRTNQLRAVAEVGKSITSYRNLSELLQQTARLINENFGYYHVGIFLLDERKQFAILTATNSEGGRKMLERGHQLKVGETGIVGYVAQNIEARIALDVGEDAVYFNNPDLPKTRSEMALPLVVSGQALGVLDVQSTEPRAFSEDDISALQILAEQIAVAIQNANLFTETEKALEASRQAYGEVTRDAWIKILRNQSRIGYIATQPNAAPALTKSVEPNLAKAIDTGDLIIADDSLTISVPIKIRGQVIGAIRLKKSDISEVWSQDETNLAVTLSDQLSSALESARLYRDSQQRAARESLVSDISARLSSISQMDLIIRETVQELGEALGNTSVTFQLVGDSNGAKPTGRENGSGKVAE